MLRKKTGQSIIEYSIIAIVVTIGIIVMGPYVIRSINAHFKIWDDQVQDSFTDKLKQVDATEISLPPGCTLTSNITKGDCGIVVGRTRTCQEGFRFEVQQTIPPNCAIIEDCKADLTDADGNPACCILEIPGTCGTTARLNISPTRGSPPDFDTFNGSAVLNRALGNTCYRGERLVTKRCGGISILGCIIDPTCNATCSMPSGGGSFANSNATMCRPIPDTDSPPVITFVDSCGTNPSEVACQAQCNTGFHANGAGTACIP